MIAQTDQSLNDNFGTVGPPQLITAPYRAYLKPILEPLFSAFSDFYGVRASVYAAPALIPTAAVGMNPWDSVFGPIGAYADNPGPSPALPLPPQVGAESFA